MTSPNPGTPIPTPAELEDLRVGVAGWGLALELVAAWRAQDQDRVVDAVEALLAAEVKHAAYALHALSIIVDGLLGDLARLAGRSADDLWAYYASAPQRIRATYGLDPDGAS